MLAMYIIVSIYNFCWPKPTPTFNPKFHGCHSFFATRHDASFRYPQVHMTSLWQKIYTVVDKYHSLANCRRDVNHFKYGVILVLTNHVARMILRDVIPISGHHICLDFTKIQSISSLTQSHSNQCSIQLRSPFCGKGSINLLRHAVDSIQHFYWIHLTNGEPRRTVPRTHDVIITSL